MRDQIYFLDYEIPNFSRNFWFSGLAWLVHWKCAQIKVRRRWYPLCANHLDFSYLSSSIRYAYLAVHMKSHGWARVKHRCLLFIAFDTLYPAVSFRLFCRATWLCVCLVHVWHNQNSRWMQADRQKNEKLSRISTKNSVWTK